MLNYQANGMDGCKEIGLCSVWVKNGWLQTIRSNIDSGILFAKKVEGGKYRNAFS